MRRRATRIDIKTRSSEGVAGPVDERDEGCDRPKRRAVARGATDVASSAVSGYALQRDDRQMTATLVGLDDEFQLGTRLSSHLGWRCSGPTFLVRRVFGIKAAR